MPSPMHTRTVTTTVVEPMPEFESLKTAAARTEISIYTLRDKAASGELRAYRFSDKPGAAIRVRRSDVDALLKPVIPGWDCGGPCLTYKGTTHGWRCRTCLAAYIDDGAIAAAARQTGERVRIRALLDGRHGGGLAAGRATGSPGLHTPTGRSHRRPSTT